jgi:hypothetical protein
MPKLDWATAVWIFLDMIGIAIISCSGISVLADCLAWAGSSKFSVGGQGDVDHAGGLDGIRPCHVLRRG